MEAAGDQVLAALQPATITGWMHTRRELQRQAAGSGSGQVRVYLPPKDGLTLSEYLLARSTGAVPVGHVTWLRASHPVSKSVKAGGVVVLDIDSAAAAVPALDGLLTQLQTQGLTAVALTLAAPAGAAVPAARSNSAVQSNSARLTA